MLSIGVAWLSNPVGRYMKRVEEFLSESGRAYTTNELATELDMTKSNIYNTTELMRGFNILDRMKGGISHIRYYYFLKDRYSDEEIAEMIPTRKVKVPRPRRRRVQFVPGKPGRPRHKTESDLFMESYLGDIDKRASTGGLRALAILGFPDINSVRGTQETVKEKKTEPVFDTGIKMSAKLTVKQLSKNMRRLTQTDLNYLKNIFKQYTWFPVIENLNTGYVKFKALKAGRYGDTFHFSKGSNSWDDVISLKVGSAISCDLLLPRLETQRWMGWNEFNIPQKVPRFYRGLYEQMLNEFIDSGHHLVEITMETRNAIATRQSLKFHIDKRGLQEQIEVSRVQEFVYLEKLT